MDVFGNPVNGGFMQRLVHPDKISKLFVLDHLGEIGDVRNAQNFTPFGALVEDLQMLGPVDIGRGVVKVRPGRQLQDEAAPELEYGEDLDITGGNGHGAVEVFPHPVDAVHIEIGNGTVLQQVDLVRHLLFLKVPDGFFLGPALFLKDQVQFRQTAHFIFNPDDILTVQVDSGQADKHAVGDGLLDPDPLVGIEVA